MGHSKYTHGEDATTYKTGAFPPPSPRVFLTSQKNSFPRKPQNHEIQDTSSELLIFLRQKKPVERQSRYYVFRAERPSLFGEYRRRGAAARPGSYP